ncbi:MAG: RNA polymerase factor sigma-54 [Thermodesulfovibrionales bacterium]|nr:RNA polymerase factor sigma-54 [Thermodesulfovibrionales bacterium]
MPLEQRLDLRLTQKLILTPQLQLAIKLLQLTQLELSQLLSQELVENPLLEEIEEDNETLETQELHHPDEIQDEDTELPLQNLYKFSIDEYFEERSSDGRDLGYFNPGLEEQPSFELFQAKKTTLQDHLLWQLMLTDSTDKIKEIAEILIGNIDDNGYLKLTDEEIYELTGADKESIDKALSVIYEFDPPGIGARTLKECLLLQIKSLGLQGSVVEQIISNDLDALCKKKYPLLMKKYLLTEEELATAIKIIQRLNPHPGSSFSKDDIVYITPDVFIYKVDGEYHITLNDETLPKIKLNNKYHKLLMQKELLSKDEKTFFKEKMKSALELIKSLEQRNKTVYKVAQSILKFQREFFDKGIPYIKPLTLKDVAADINMHESTISRVTSTKFLACSQGIFSFKFFFSSSVKSTTGQVSSTSVKDIIKKIITEEDPKKPLSDKEIAEKLKIYDIKIARRTVAKYRDELKIPQQTLRKRMISD